MASSDQPAAPPSLGTPSMPESLRRLSITNPIIFSSTTWAALCVGYALWQVPEAPLTSPELLREQLQLRIRSIPVPSSSPRYQQFKEYYTREHDLQLQEYKVARATWQQSTSSFNWRAFAQGLGVGVLVLSAALAILEYHYGLISYWMEVAEELWREAQQKREKRLQLADSAKMERLLQEIGEGADDGAGKGAPKRRKVPETEVRQRVKSPAPYSSEPKATSIPPPQALPTASVPAVPKEEAPKAIRTPQGAAAMPAEEPTPAQPAAAEPKEEENPTLLQGSAATTSAARLRERLRCKVIERHRQQTEQASTPSSQDGSATPELTEPQPKKEKKKNKKAQAKKEEPAEESSKPAEEDKKAEEKQEEQGVEVPETAAPVQQSAGDAAEKDAPTKTDQAAPKKKNSKAKKAEAKPSDNCRSGSKETPAKPANARKADPEVEAALQRLAKQPLTTPTLRGPELLREAQELLSRLEAEDLLKQLETEEELARRAAGKKKAKKDKAAARAKAASKKGQKSEVPADEPAADLAVLEEEYASSSTTAPSSPAEDALSSSSTPEAVEPLTKKEKRKQKAQAKKEEPAPASKPVATEAKKELEVPAVQPATGEVEKEAPRKGEQAGSKKKNSKAKKAEARPSEANSRTSSKETPAKQQNARKESASEAELERPAAPAPTLVAESLPVVEAVEAEEEFARRAGGKKKAKQNKAVAKQNVVTKIEPKGEAPEEASKADLSRVEVDSASSSTTAPPSPAEVGFPATTEAGFDGALAGAHLLDILRGTSHKDQRQESVWKGKSKSWPSEPKEPEAAQAPEASSLLRAEAPEFVPGQTVSDPPEAQQPMMPNMIMAEQLPLGCQIVMVPVQLAQMPMFEDGVMPGMQLVGMPMNMMEHPGTGSEPQNGWAPYPEQAPSQEEQPRQEEQSQEQTGYNTDDDCESVFGEPIAMKRQLTI